MSDNAPLAQNSPQRSTWCAEALSLVPRPRSIDACMHARARTTDRLPRSCRGRDCTRCLAPKRILSRFERSVVPWDRKVTDGCFRAMSYARCSLPSLCAFIALYRPSQRTHTPRRMGRESEGVGSARLRQAMMNFDSSLAEFALPLEPVPSCDAVHHRLPCPVRPTPPLNFTVIRSSVQARMPRGVR